MVWFVTFWIRALVLFTRTRLLIENDTLHSWKPFVLSDVLVWLELGSGLMLGLG